MSMPIDPTRLKTAADSVGTDKPQLATTLASSGLSSGQIQQVGGFAQALQLATANRLAVDSGAKTNFTNNESDKLNSVNEPPANPKADSTDSRSWLEKAVDGVAGVVSNTGNFLFHNPVTGAIEDVGNWLGNAAHLPFRMLSTAVHGDTDEVDREMSADGYDPNSTTSYLAFMFSQGENVYHDLSKARDTYGDDLVDQIVQAQRDPQAFQDSLVKMPAEQAAALQQKMNSKEWQEASDAVSAQHVSPGRDIAGLLTLGHKNNVAFHLLSGTLDAAYDWFTDPTLVLGKASVAVHALDAAGRLAEDAGVGTKMLNAAANNIGWLGNKRAGIQGALDQTGIEAILATKKVANEAGEKVDQAVTKVGKAWQSFLDDAKSLREQYAASQDTSLSAEARAAAAGQRAGIYRAMVNRYGQTLMPLLDEVNGNRVVKIADQGVGQPVDRLAEAADSAAGGHVIRQGAPITELSDLADYLSSTGGLLRLKGGLAAKRAVMMPGKLSYRAERMAAGDTKLAQRTAAKTQWIDYTKPSQVLPVEGEDVVAGLDGQARSAADLGDEQFDRLRKSAVLSVQSARAKADRISRRFTTLVPNVAKIDLSDPNAHRVVEQFARTYLNKGDSARLASAFQVGDLGVRRGVMKGLLEQTFHASGLSRSADGQEFMDKYLADFDRTGDITHQYGFGDSSVINDNGAARQAALYPDQLSNTVTLPSFREMNYLAAKYAVGGWSRSQRISTSSLHAIGQGSAADKLMQTVKLGWIATAAGGFRNALDEVANFAVNGMGREVLSARSAFTQATSEVRAARRSASKEYQQILKTGRDSAGNVFGDGRISRQLADKKIGEQVGGALKSHADATRELERATRAQSQLDTLPQALQQRADDAQARLDAANEGGDAEEIRKATQALKQHQTNLANPQKAAARLAQQHADRGILSVPDAKADVEDALGELKRTRALESAIRYRVPLAFRQAADNVNDLMVGTVLGKAMSVFGKQYAVTPERVEIARELVDGELTQVLREGVFQSHYNDSGAMLASDDYAMDLHRNGLRARKYAYQSRYKGWGEVEADGGAGLDAMAKTLQLRFADPSSPAHSWIQTLLPQLDEDGHITQEALDSATASVRARLEDDDPALRQFMERAEVFHTTKGGVRVGDDEALQAQVKDEYAQRVSADLLQALAVRGSQKEGMIGADGARMNRELAEALFDSYHTGMVPDRSWLANSMPQADRPETAIGQLWAPYNSAHEPGTMPRGYTQMMTRAYDKVVTDQINALSRNPLVTALYMNARENTGDYVEALKGAGWSQEAADEVAKRISLRHAQDEALKHIDNPYVASQFSLVNRNYASFVRAQEDWLRRWGRTLQDNPDMIRKGQLLIHGGESAGLVESDDQGNLQFVYPGSGLALNLFGKLFGIGGMENGARVPVGGELTSQLQMLNPSLDNPLGLTATPLISLPMKALTSFLGNDHALLSASLDQAVNGQMGAGRKWYETMLPSWANRILGGVLSTDPGSKYGAAYTQALANMEAAGQLDDPALQTPSGKARFQQSLQASIHNNLLATALFGFFAPAAPTLNPQADGQAHNARLGEEASPWGTGNSPDWSAHQAGLSSLRDEARQVFSRLPYDQALAWWQAVHPGELIYAQTGASSRTTVSTKDASAPATIAAAEWMQKTPYMQSQYGGKGGVYAYFMPQGQAGTKDGEYSDVAYRAQLEAGIRSYKSLDDYFDDIVTARGEKQYFDAKDAYDAEASRLVQAGDKQGKAQLDAQWKAKKDELYAGNPLLSAKFATFATANSSRDNQIAQLSGLVTDTHPEVLKALGDNRNGVAALLEAYSEYQQGTAALGTKASNAANKQRQALRDTYEARVQALAGTASSQYPDLTDLARGVFRLPS